MLLPFHDISLGKIRPEDVDDPEKLAKQLNKMRESIGWAQTNFEAASGAIGQPSFRRLYIPGEESRSSSSYGALTTPDEVMNIGMPNGGLIVVAYQAIWKSSVSTAGNAAVFLDGNQVHVAGGSSDPVPQEATTLGTNTYTPLSSSGAGLTEATTATGYNGDVTTGQLVAAENEGGVAYIFAAQGTYTVGVLFRASSGSVTVKERRLTVWTEGVASGAAA